METKESLVIDLIPEQRVLFNGHICHVQGRDKGSMIVSKVKNSPYVFGLSIYSPRYKDLMNRVAVVL